MGGAISERKGLKHCCGVRRRDKGRAVAEMLWSLLSVLLALFCVFLTVLYWR